MSTITIRIRFPANFAKGEVVSKLNESHSIEKVLVELSKEHNFFPDQFGLQLENGDWLSPETTVSQARFTTKTILVMKNKFILSAATCFNSKANFRNKLLCFPLLEPISDSYSYIARKFAVPETSLREFELVIEGKWDDLLVDPLVSIPEIESKKLLFKSTRPERPFSPLEFSIFQDLLRKEARGILETDSESSEFTSSEVPLDAPANKLLQQFPKLNGYITKYNLKKKKWDRYFCIILNEFMFFYTNQSDDKPTQFINLEKYETQKVPDDLKKKLQYALELSGPEEKLLIKVDDSKWQDLWFNGIKSSVLEAQDAKNAKKEAKKASSASASQVFGVSLDKLMEQYPGAEVPPIFTKCISYIEERALRVEGIFRLSGSATLIEKYKNLFNNGEDVDLSAESDPHAVSGLFKLWFRDLPDPVVPWDHYPKFMTAERIKNPSLRLRYFKFLIKSLPPINQNLLRLLVLFLVRVVSFSEYNKMPIHNIATVFGPNLLKKKGANMIELVEDTPQINNIVGILITNEEYFFRNGSLPNFEEEEDSVAAKATYDYVPDPSNENSKDDLVFKKNDIISIIFQGPPDGWWIGELEERFGRFPGSYIQVLSPDQWAKVKRRLKFNEELLRIKQNLLDEEQTIAKLQEERAKLEEQRVDVERLFSELKVNFSNTSSFVQNLISNRPLHELPSKLEKYTSNLGDWVASQSAIAESRTQLITEIEAYINEAAAAPVDKKKKPDKKTIPTGKDAIIPALNGIRAVLDVEEDTRLFSAEIEKATIIDLLEFNRFINFLRY